MTSSIISAAKETTNERFPPYDDSVLLQLTPEPSGIYRCPVSTPANNYIQRAGKIRRTKPVQGQLLFSQPTQNTNGSGRSQGGQKLTGLMRSNRPPKSLPWTSKSIDYYYVDQVENRREEELTNTHWLKALCSQPVNEILGKYRRRTDVRRTHVTNHRACSTPGERSLLNAWESNITTRCGRNLRRRMKCGAQSAAVRGGAAVERGDSAFTNNRGTKSEPALSRAQQALTEEDFANARSPGRNVPPPSPGKLSARSDHLTWGSSGRHGGNGELSATHGYIPRIKGFLMDDPASDEEEGRESAQPPPQPRFVSFTTQLYRRTTNGQEETYNKMTRGPEHLPYISNNKRVVSMIYNTKVYGRHATATTASNTDAGHGASNNGDTVSDVNRTLSVGSPSSKNYKEE